MAIPFLQQRVAPQASCVSTIMTQLIPGQTTNMHCVSLGRPHSSKLYEAVSALDRVPLEIWQEIYLLMLSSEDIPALDEVVGPIWGRPSPPASLRGKLILPQTPIIVSQVCWRWRAYAFGMPDLWNVFCVKAPRLPSTASARNLAELVQKRLILSSPLPVKICIDSKDSEEAACALLRAITPFSSRWETIHLHIPPDALAELFSLRSTDLPLLTSFKTYMQIYALGYVGPYQLSLFDNIPPIKRFCTSYLSPPTCHFYAGLEELNIQESRSETWSTLHVLAACHKLRILTLSGVGITMASAAPSTPYPDLVLTQLHTLNLEHPTGRERLLEMMRLPKLRALTIGGSCSGESTRSVLSAVMMLMDRSEVDSLERLAIYFERHTSEPALLVTFLCRNPFLKELTIDDTWKFLNHRPLVTSGLLQALTCSDAYARKPKPYICPRLERISLVGCSDFEDETLLFFLKSRCLLGQLPISETDTRSGDYAALSDKCCSPATLKEVYISMKRKFEGELLGVIQSWKLMGFPIDLCRL